LNPQFEEFLKQCANNENQRPYSDGTMTRLKVLDREREKRTVDIRGGSYNNSSSNISTCEIRRILRDLVDT
jgi:hypothetical protein